MKSFVNNLCISLLLFIAFSCDEEINKPVFQTLDVSELSTEGVTLNGRFQVSGNQNITDYGFIWAEHAEPEISDASYSFHGKPVVGKFQYRVADGLKNGTKYYVRAFVKASNQTVYSNIVSFTALGSATPVILDFNPTSGGANDTVTVIGDHFGENLTSLSVSIGQAVCKIISVTREKIVFRLPLKYISGSYPIALKVAEKTVASTGTFTLEGPVIQSISPSSGPAGTIVTLTGTGFSTTPASNIVYFGDKKATVMTATSGQLEVTAPVSSIAEEKLVSLEINDATAYSPTRFILTGPVITSFSPTSGTEGSQIVINGSGFSPILSENLVKIYPYHYVSGTVLSATPNQLVVEIGRIYYSGIESQLISNISVEVKLIVAVTKTPFTINGPTITSIIPAMQYEGRTITISGSNFDPAGDNRVYFSGKQGSVINSSATSLTVKVPFTTPALPSQSQISISAKGYTFKSSSQLNVLSPWQQLSDFPGGSRWGVTTFTVGSYSYVTMGLEHYVGDKKDVWRFDPSKNLWTRMADFPGSPRAFAFSFVVNGKAYVGGGGHYGGSSYDLISNLYDLWEYDPVADSWTQKRSFSQNATSGKRFQATGIGQYGYFGIDNYFYRYDPSSNLWSVSNAAINFSQGGVAATIGDKGYFGLGIYSSTFWEFDPAMGSWSELATSPVLLGPGWGVLTSFTLDDKVYVGSHNMFVRFDPAVNEWSQLPNIPIELSYKGAFGASGMGYMITGRNGTGFSNFYIFNPNY